VSETSPTVVAGVYRLAGDLAVVAFVTPEIWACPQDPGAERISCARNDKERNEYARKAFDDLSLGVLGINGEQTAPNTRPFSHHQQLGSNRSRCTGDLLRLGFAVFGLRCGSG